MKVKYALCACFLFAALLLPAQTADAAKAKVSISFLNRGVYYPGNAKERPILVTCTITNSGTDTYRFRLAEDHFFSLGFSAITLRNRALPPSGEWLQRRTQSGQVYFREITLEPGESYSFVENVKDYLTILEPGVYVLECAFFPELRRLPDYSELSIASNRLTLEIKPEPAAALAAGYLPADEATGGILRPQAIAPDQVVEETLTARQRSQWERFFLYLDLEQMLEGDPARKARFLAASENGRLDMVENYKVELMQSRAENQISLVPSEFRIERTAYTSNEGTVTAIEWFDYPDYRERKRFTYTLARRDNIWRITGYTVDNLGTE